MWKSLLRFFDTRRLDREEEADFRRCVLGQTDLEIEMSMGEQAAAQALADVESRQMQVKQVRQKAATFTTISTIRWFP